MLARGAYRTPRHTARAHTQAGAEVRWQQTTRLELIPPAEDADGYAAAAAAARLLRRLPNLLTLELAGFEAAGLAAWVSGPLGGAGPLPGVRELLVAATFCAAPLVLTARHVRDLGRLLPNLAEARLEVGRAGRGGAGGGPGLWAGSPPALAACTDQVELVVHPTS